jgi:hypothetical protein
MEPLAAIEDAIKRLDVPPPPAGTQPQYTFQNLSLDADIDVKEGQKVVVGRLSIHDQALFLVLTAHVVN